MVMQTAARCLVVDDHAEVLFINGTFGWSEVVIVLCPTNLALSEERSRRKSVDWHGLLSTDRQCREIVGQ